MATTKKLATLVSRTAAPTFQHDCECCRFLGSLDGEDLYSCKSDSFVRRFGDAPEQYGSLGDLTPPGTPYAFARALEARGQAPAAYRTK